MAHLRGEQGKPGLLKPETFKRLHTPPFGGDYAFGWLITDGEWAGGRALTHAGSNTQNYALVRMAPRRNLAVLVTTNQGGDKAAKACDQAAAALMGFYLKGR